MNDNLTNLFQFTRDCSQSVDVSSQLSSLTVNSQADSPRQEHIESIYDFKSWPIFNQEPNFCNNEIFRSLATFPETSNSQDSKLPYQSSNREMDAFGVVEGSSQESVPHSLLVDEDTAHPDKKLYPMALHDVIKSNSVSERVAVPTSDHAAEIIGKNGCKIKELRRLTNTYIKSPVRNQETEFLVTGTPENVSLVKEYILQQAQHFTDLRKQPLLQSFKGISGQLVSLNVRVAKEFVGLVVGPKGKTIKKIQEDTHTHIVTPNYQKEPIFVVTGLQFDVERARDLMNQHIDQRTTQEELVADNSIVSDLGLQLSKIYNSRSYRIKELHNLLDRPRQAAEKFNPFSGGSQHDHFNSLSNSSYSSGELMYGGMRNNLHQKNAKVLGSEVSISPSSSDTNSIAADDFLLIN